MLRILNLSVILKHFLIGAVSGSLLAGCGAPDWKGYDDIQLGQPLPHTLPDQMERTILGAGYIGSPGGEGSFFGADMRLASVLTDADETVAAKSQLSIATAHRVLYVQTSYRYKMEADLSYVSGNSGKASEVLTLVASVSQQVADRPSDSQVGPSGRTDSSMDAACSEISRCMSVMDEAIYETRGDPDSSDISQMRHKRYAGASVRFSKALNQSLAIRLAGRRIESRMSSLPARTGGMRQEPFTPRNIPEAMVYNHILLNTLTRPSQAYHAEQASKVHALYVQYAHDRVVEILGDADTYSRVGPEHVDHSWRTLDGLTVRLSGTRRRLAIEITGLVVRDPVMTETDMDEGERIDF